MLAIKVKAKVNKLVSNNLVNNCKCAKYQRLSRHSIKISTDIGPISQVIR